MKSTTLATAITTALLALSSPTHAQMAPDNVSALDFIQLFEKLGGKHPGMRKAHAKGICATGSFLPAADAAQLSDAPLLNEGKIKANIRFSLGGPNPFADERSPGTRGVGVQLKLNDGSIHNFTGNNTPVFTGKDPETFFGFLETLLPGENGKPDREKMGAYIAANPSVQPALAFSRTQGAPSSYARSNYFGIHSFFYDNDAGDRTMFRWQLVPSLEEQVLSEADRKELDKNYLGDVLRKEVSEQSVSFSLVASIGEEGDSVIDPSQQWPKERETVKLGEIRVESVGGEACTATNFDPNVVSKGFSGSDDPVLKMRSPAYGISMGKRLSNQ